MAASPYSNLPATAFWRDSVAQTPSFLIDPMVRAPFTIDRATKVATAGSCFAQNIARRLRDAGFAYYVAEEAPEGMPQAEATARNFGVFSARYGNIYSVRQLVQTFDRAFGSFKPAVTSWARPDGRFVDPYRPRIEPEGFATAGEVEAAAQAHLQAVRTMFETLDVFVFTLGLTESWAFKADSAVVPVAPGAAAGTWEPAEYSFINWSSQEVSADLIAFADKLKSVNPAARIILTVSPVPLVATYSGHHVMHATAYSKAVLRVAAEEAAAARPQIAYFPSYEIVTSPAAGHRYFEPDMRNVTTQGVDHVMRVFFRHFAGLSRVANDDERAPEPIFRLGDGQAGLVCDEEELEAHRRLTKGAAPVVTPDPAPPPVTVPQKKPGLLDKGAVDLARRAVRKAHRLLRSATTRS